LEERPVPVPLWAWAGFVAFVVVMLAVDLFVLHRDAHEVSVREAGIWSAVWIALALGFWGVLWAWRGGDTADAYLAGYLIEKSLSVDNIFVFALIFSKLAIPPRYQHRVLMYGIVGALVMRAAFIAGGAALLDAAHVVIPRDHPRRRRDQDAPQRRLQAPDVGVVGLHRGRPRRRPGPLRPNPEPTRPDRHRGPGSLGRSRNRSRRSSLVSWSLHTVRKPGSCGGG
jgi:hypothetical protein